MQPPRRTAGDTAHIANCFCTKCLDDSKVLYKLGHSRVRLGFRIEYTVAEPDKCKNELLANAVTDAKAKADVLFKASGVSLGETVIIDYSWAEMVWQCVRQISE